MPVLIATKTINAGTEQTPVINIPSGIGKVELWIDRTAFTDTDIACTVQLFLSYDNGKAWRPHGSFGTIGGIIPGDTENKSAMIIDLPQPTNNQRRIMATITVTKAFTTSLSYEIVG